jgi:hypothetical protein
MSREPTLGCSVTLTQDYLEPGTERPVWLRASALDGPTLNLMPSALMARRVVFDAVGMFDHRLAIHEESEWFRRCDLAGVERGVVNEALVDRRVHDRNLSHRNPRGVRDYPRFLKEHIDRSRALDER